MFICNKATFLMPLLSF